MIKIVPLILSLILLSACKAPAAASRGDKMQVFDEPSSLLDMAIDSEIDAMDFTFDYERIMGEPKISHKVMTEFVRRHNKNFSPEIARCYIEIGRLYGIRGDIAFCQAIIETGWFRFDGGTAVRPSQHNYCGLGVSRRGSRGEKFATVSDGVTAHIQHLYAYATDEQLPSGERLLDPRFKMVMRGSATTWSDLNMRWAMNDSYADNIMRVYHNLIDFSKGRK